MPEMEKGQHFLDYWRVLKSRKEWVIGIALLFIVTGTILTVLLPREYMAYARIAVAPARADVPLSQSREIELWYSPFFMKTQLEIIQSQKVLDKVVEELRLQERFAPADGAKILTKREARNRLRRHLEVSPYLDTNIILIEVRMKEDSDTICEDVADIANKITEQYMAVSKEMMEKRTSAGVNALEDQYRSYDEKVRLQEKKVSELRKELDLPSVDFRTADDETASLETARLPALESSRRTARNDMIDRKARLDMIKGLDYEQQVYAIDVAIGDVTLGQLRQDRIEARMKLRDLLESHGERHPEVLRSKTAIAALDEEIAGIVEGAIIGLQTDYDIARVTLEEIDAELERERQRNIQGSGERYVPFYNEQAELKRLRDMRDSLELRWREENAELRLPQTPMRVIDKAEAPFANEYVSPKFWVNMIVSVVLGLGCGICIAFFVEYVDTTVKTVEDIEHYIGARVLGVIPQRIQFLAKSGKEVPEAESYRILRTNMQFAKMAGHGRTVCVTSGGIGEGKSFTVANLGYVMAQRGEKVLIVDADMRRPQQHRLFERPASPGLPDVLRGDMELEDAICETGVPGLHLLPSGKPEVASPGGLLDSEGMKDLIECLAERYDWVLMDAPPVLGVSDASVMIGKVAGVLLVVKHRGYSRAVSSQAKKTIENVGGNLLGVVLNSINVTRAYTDRYPKSAYDYATAARRY